MAHWLLSTYTRTSLVDDWYIRHNEAELLAHPLGVKITEFKDSGKITHYERKESDDGFKQFFKIGFKDEASYNEFIALSDYGNTRTEQQSWINDMGLTYSEAVSADEPAI